MKSPASDSSSAACSKSVRHVWISLFIAALVFLLPHSLLAHDIPNDVTVQAFVKPEGQKLHLLLRVPLNAMRDTEFPERDAGYLDLARVDASLREAAMVWIADAIDVHEEIPACPILKSSKFAPRCPPTNLSRLTTRLMPMSPGRACRMTYRSIGIRPCSTSCSSIQFIRTVREFSIHPGLARLGLRVITALRFLPPDGAVRAFEFIGDPGLVRLDPRWYQAALRFVKLGFFHILDGTDHLLFLFCLVIRSGAFAR